MARRPLIGVPADVKGVGEHPFHAAGEKYLKAVFEVAGCMPLIIPAFGAALDLPQLLANFDGVLLTGSVSNVEPWRYGAAAPPCEPHDPQRDATTLDLIGAVLALGMPLLGICRGLQELNVALGGTLCPAVHALPGRLNHRAPEGAAAVQYAPSHEVELTPGGVFQEIAGGATRLRVNSLHEQGIDRLAPGLAIEATATDGTIEAVRVIDATGFALGVQWHPEWQAAQSPFSVALFQRFGDAARRFRQ